MTFVCRLRSSPTPVLQTFVGTGLYAQSPISLSSYHIDFHTTGCPLRFIDHLKKRYILSRYTGLSEGVTLAANVSVQLHKLHNLLSMHRVAGERQARERVRIIIS